MKLLILMSILQTGAIAFLLARAVESPVPAAQTVRATQYDGESSPLADEQLLRRIIREELAQQQLLAVPSVPTSQTGKPSAVEPPVAKIDHRSQLQLVEKQLEYYRVQGAISATEMHKLQGEIAKLDPATRKQMLARLVQAMNAGEIRGAL